MIYVIVKKYGWTGDRIGAGVFVEPTYISLVRYPHENSQIVENAAPEQAWSTTDLESAKKALAYVQRISGMDRIEALLRFGIYPRETNQ
jgi:hypothetical protein